MLTFIKSDAASIYALSLLGFTHLLLPKHLQSQFYLYTCQLHPDFHIAQIITAHVSHLSWQHWLGNFIGLIVFQQFYGHCINRGQWIAKTLLLILIISITLMIFSNNLLWYAGLSSVIIGLACYCAITDNYYHRRTNLTVLITIIIYTIAQLTDGELSQGFGDIPVASYSHLAAVIGGIVLGSFTRLTSSRIKSRV